VLPSHEAKPERGPHQRASLSCLWLTKLRSSSTRLEQKYLCCPTAQPPRANRALRRLERASGKLSNPTLVQLPSKAAPFCTTRATEKPSDEGLVLASPGFGSRGSGALPEDGSGVCHQGLSADDRAAPRRGVHTSADISSSLSRSPSRPAPRGLTVAAVRASSEYRKTLGELPLLLGWWRWAVDELRAPAVICVFASDPVSTQEATSTNGVDAAVAMGPLMQRDGVTTPLA